MEFGPQLPITPRANPVGDPLGANAQAAAVTETGISREPRGVTFVTPKNSRQVLANEAKNANIAKNTAGSGYDAMATANIPPAVAQQVPVAVAQSNASGDPSEDSTAFEDPRETINPDPMNTGTYSNDGKSLVPSQISDSQLSLGQARNAEPRDMYGRSPVDQTSSAFNLSPSNLASQANHMILKNNPYVDSIYLNNKNNIFLDLPILFKLRKKKIDVCFEFDHSVVRHAIIRLKIINPKKVISVEKTGRYGLHGSKLQIYDYYTEKLKDNHFRDIWLATLKPFNVMPESKRYDIFYDDLTYLYMPNRYERCWEQLSLSSLVTICFQIGLSQAQHKVGFAKIVMKCQ